MRIYIVREGRSIEFYVVAAKWKAAFLAGKHRKILAWGRTLPEAVKRLGGVAEKLAILSALAGK
jgi:hypothetical protein